MIEIDISKQTIREAVDALVDATNRVYAAGERAYAARAELKRREAAILLEGVEGKNAESRQAVLMEASADERAEVEQAEALLRAAQSERDVIALGWDEQKWLIRLEAVRAGVSV